MSDRPLLTIAVPTYNGSRTICSMLDVLLPQIEKDVEVIISDNCSTDSTPDIIKKYVEKYPYIRTIRNETNMGADGNFLQCMRMATGKFTLLISDDDIIIEDAVKKICDYLKDYPETKLAYLDTVEFKDKYIDKEHTTRFKQKSKPVTRNIRTTDKTEFISYVGRQWGFTSSFLWNTDQCQSIPNPERFFNTYWLQSYIHIYCSKGDEAQLGLIAGPCVAAGSYGIINNYDIARIEGIFFKKMLISANKIAGYNLKQLESLWRWKICFLASRSIIKERAIGVKKTSAGTLFFILKKYPYAWLHLFPFFIIPKPVCKLILKFVRWKQGRKELSFINRTT